MSALKELYNCMSLSSEVRAFFNEAQKNLTTFMNLTKGLNIKEFDDLVTIHKHRLMKLDELSYRLSEIHLTAVKLDEERKSRTPMEIKYKYNLEELQKDYNIIEKELECLENKLHIFETVKKYREDIDVNPDLNNDIKTLKSIKRNIEKSIDIIKYFIDEE